MELIRQLPDTWVSVKEAGSIRGLPDLFGCKNGKMFVFEVKRSREEAEKESGRIVLQRHTLHKIQKAGGLAMIVHPDNVEEVLEKLRSL